MPVSKLQPTTYIGIHERTQELRVLYVSSSVRQALLYDPEDILSLPTHELIADMNDLEYIRAHHGNQTDDNIIMTTLFAKSKDNRPVFVRSIAFACGNVCFHMATTYPNISFDQPKNRLTVQKYKCTLSILTAKREQQIRDNSLADSHHGLNNSSSSWSTSCKRRGKLGKSATQKRGRVHQACIVLEQPKASHVDGNAGARIIFVTDSINRILNVDSCDLQNLPFLFLVAPQDIAKATRFLDKAHGSDELVLERLHLLENPVEDSQLENPRRVSVEFMAMGSDAGAIMLCQLDYSKSVSANNGVGYLSLEDIISSDPETSDLQ